MVSFNPRTHMGCDICAVKHQNSLLCFNPRTHMGCDMPTKQAINDMCGFNPRTHMGCDMVVLRIPFLFRYVSIHAPTWGATPQIDGVYYDTVFQSTHPHGVRRP